MKTLIACICILGGTLFFTACRSQKKKTSTAPNSAEIVNPTKPDSLQIEKTEELKYTFKPQQTEFESLKVKSKIDIRSAKLNQTIPASIHVKKDSVIWLSVSIGLEVARVSINSDSLFFMDRINRKHYKFSFEELSQQFHFPFTYQMMQSLLVGNLPIAIDSSDLYAQNTDFKSLIQKRNEVEITNKFELSQNRLFAIEAIDHKSESKLNVIYKNFVVIDNFEVPRNITLQISNQKKIPASTVNIEIEHTKFDFLDRTLRFPYSVPKGFRLELAPSF
jgi:Domain of unknown function (DUF4292)